MHVLIARAKCQEFDRIYITGQPIKAHCFLYNMEQWKHRLLWFSSDLGLKSSSLAFQPHDHNKFNVLLWDSASSLVKRFSSDCCTVCGEDESQQYMQSKYWPRFLPLQHPTQHEPLSQLLLLLRVLILLSGKKVKALETEPTGKNYIEWRQFL